MSEHDCRSTGRARSRTVTRAGRLGTGPVAVARALVSVLMFCSLTLLVAQESRAEGEQWRGVGRKMAGVSRPTAASLQLCSSREALCIHTVGRVAADHVTETLLIAERVMRSLRGLGLQAPLDDGGLGGNHAHDLYLDLGVRNARAQADLGIQLGNLDSASAFGLLPGEKLGPHCSFQSDVARVLSQAVLLRMDGALHQGTLAMQSSYLASIIAPCDPLETAAVDELQRAPQRALSSGAPDRLSGTMLLPAYLDATYGLQGPGSVMNGIIAVGSQRTPPDVHWWHNEPDIFDVLRSALKARSQSLGDALIDFAIARAFIGSRNDGAHLPDVSRFGDMGRVRFEWSVGYDSLPRNLAPMTPVSPTGASYLWLDLSGVSPKSRLSFVARWEESFVFQWALVKISKTGKELSRRVGGGVWGRDTLQLSLAKVDDAAAVLIVGTSLGNDDRSNPFDPEDGAPRPANYEVTLYAR